MKPWRRHVASRPPRPTINMLTQQFRCVKLLNQTRGALLHVSGAAYCGRPSHPGMAGNSGEWIGRYGLFARCFFRRERLPFTGMPRGTEVAVANRRLGCERPNVHGPSSGRLEAPGQAAPSQEPSPRKPRAARSAAARPEDPESLLVRMPTAEEIAAFVRRRPIGAMIADICQRLWVRDATQAVAGRGRRRHIQLRRLHPLDAGYVRSGQPREAVSARYVDHFARCRRDGGLPGGPLPAAPDRPEQGDGWEHEDARPGPATADPGVADRGERGIGWAIPSAELHASRAARCPRHGRVRPHQPQNQAARRK